MTESVLRTINYSFTVEGSIAPKNADKIISILNDGKALAELVGEPSDLYDLEVENVTIEKDVSDSDTGGYDIGFEFDLIIEIDTDIYFDLDDGNMVTDETLSEVYETKNSIKNHIQENLEKLGCLDTEVCINGPDIDDLCYKVSDYTKEDFAPEPDYEPDY